MPASPAMSAPPISPGEMQLLLSRAGLVLNPGQVADLVLAWRQVAGLIASIPHDRPLADDMAVGFHLPPPPETSASEPAPAKGTRPPKAKVAAKPKATASRGRPAAEIKAKAKVKARPKAAPKRRAAKPPGRKTARRRR